MLIVGIILTNSASNPALMSDKKGQGTAFIDVARPESTIIQSHRHSHRLTQTQRHTLTQTDTHTDISIIF